MIKRIVNKIKEERQQSVRDGQTTAARRGSTNVAAEYEFVGVK